MLRFLAVDGLARGGNITSEASGLPPADRKPFLGELAFDIPDLLGGIYTSN